MIGTLIANVVSTGSGLVAGLCAERLAAKLLVKLLTQEEAKKLIIRVGMTGITCAVGVAASGAVKRTVNEAIDTINIGANQIKSAIQKNKEVKE